MSSPGARQRRRREQYQQPRTRRELATAVGAGLFIVLTTAFMIWILRPGGIADRQPRSSWLFGVAIGAAAVAGYVTLRPSSRLKVDRKVALAGSLGAIAVITAIAGFFWPGGLLRHTPKVEPFTAPVTTRETLPPTSATSVGGSTTTAATGATTTTAAPAATTTTLGGTPSTKSGATTTSTIP